MVEYQVDRGFVFGEIRVPSANLSICSGRSFMMRRAWSMGMVVWREVASKDTILSPGSIFCWHMKEENDLELWVCLP